MLSFDRKTMLATEPSTAVAYDARLLESRSLLALARKALRHNALLAFIVLAYLCAGALEELALGVNVRSQLSGVAYAMSKFQVLVGFLVFCLYLVYLAFVVKPDKIFPHAAGRLREILLSRERWAYALPPMILLPLFIASFTAIKTMIPMAQPFAWDPLFAEWDRLLHGGIHPWEWLQPILGYPLVTMAIYKVYIAWLLAIHIILFWQVFSLQRPVLRMRFLIAFVLTWALVGSLGGTLLSSAGPVYFGAVTGLADPYAPLLAHLHALQDMPGFELVKIQEWLWSTYAGGLTRDYAGISAMPSMHVAVATLLALLGWKTHRYLGWALSVFALLILIGSVHLAWHYAIDGYVGAVAAVLIWLGTGFVLRRWPRLLGPEPLAR